MRREGRALSAALEDACSAGTIALGPADAGVEADQQEREPHRHLTAHLLCKWREDRFWVKLFATPLSPQSVWMALALCNSEFCHSQHREKINQYCHGDYHSEPDVIMNY